MTQPRYSSFPSKRFVEKVYFFAAKQWGWRGYMQLDGWNILSRPVESTRKLHGKNSVSNVARGSTYIAFPRHLWRVAAGESSPSSIDCVDGNLRSEAPEYHLKERARDDVLECANARRKCTRRVCANFYNRIFMNAGALCGCVCAIKLWSRHGNVHKVAAEHTLSK